MLLIASSINSNVDVQRKHYLLIMLFLPQEAISLQGKDSRCCLLEANVRLEIPRSNITGKMLQKVPCRSNVPKSSGNDKSHAEWWFQDSLCEASLCLQWQKQSCELPWCWVQAGAYKNKEPVVGSRLLTTRSSLLGRGQTPSNKVISRHILEVSFSLSAGWVSEARDPMRMLQALFVHPTPEGKGQQHFGILSIQISRYEHEKHSFSAASYSQYCCWKHLEGAAIKRRWCCCCFWCALRRSQVPCLYGGVQTLLTVCRTYRVRSASVLVKGLGAQLGSGYLQATTSSLQLLQSTRITEKHLSH